MSAAELLRVSTGARVGTLVHAAFESCEWIEDFVFHPDSLDTRGATAEVAKTALAIIEHGFASDEIRSALSRQECSAPADAEVRVFNEYAFSLFLDETPGGGVVGDGGSEAASFWNGAIDRLILAERDGEVVWAEVIDFKSDRIQEGELDSKAEAYRPQLAVYARVVAAQTGLPVDRVRLRLAFVSIGRVVDIARAP